MFLVQIILIVDSLGSLKHASFSYLGRLKYLLFLFGEAAYGNTYLVFHENLYVWVCGVNDGTKGLVCVLTHRLLLNYTLRSE